jgi:hypothetical protein
VTAKGVRYVVIFALIALLPAACIVHDHNLAAGFATISDGMTQNAVKTTLGQPSGVLDCSPGIFAPPGLPDSCVEIYVYASTWEPLNPEYHVVYFDREKRVISKYDFASP